MISNYHTASSGEGGNAYYTLAGFDSGNDRGSKGRSNGRRPTSRSPNRKGLWGRRRLSSNESAASEHSSVGSLAYSAGSSVQSAGESTDSSQFSGLLKGLELEDSKQLSKLEKKLQMGHRSSVSIHSGASSLNYSDTDGEASRDSRSRKLGFSSRSIYSTDYSTDQESHLEGSKVIEALMQDDPRLVQKSKLAEEKKEQPFIDMRFEEARSPTKRTKSKDTKKQVIGSTTAVQGAAPVRRTNSKSSYTSRDASTGSKSRNRSATDQATPPTWACGTDLLEEYLPNNVKTVLRPYLCGVL